MNKNYAVLVAALAVTGMVSAAEAGLVTYDGLSQNSGVLAASSSPGSVGWNAAWDVQDGVSAVNYKYADSSPLTYPGLVSTSQYASGGNAFQGSGRQLATGFGSVWDATGQVSDPFSVARIDTGKLWMSVLVRKNTFNNTSPFTVSLHQSNIAWLVNGNPRLDIGYFGGEFGNGPGDVGGEKRLGLRYDHVNGDSNDTDVTAISSVALAEGQTFLLVLGVDLDANTADLYVNPASLGGAAPATPDASISFGAATDGTTFGARSVSWYAGRDAGMGDLDEVRLGTTFGSVTPVIPEPAGLGLLAVAGAIVARRRR